MKISKKIKFDVNFFKNFIYVIPHILVSHDEFFKVDFDSFPVPVEYSAPRKEGKQSTGHETKEKKEREIINDRVCVCV